MAMSQKAILLAEKKRQEEQARNAAAHPQNGGVQKTVGSSYAPAKEAYRREQYAKKLKSASDAAQRALDHFVATTTIPRKGLLQDRDSYEFRQLTLLQKNAANARKKWEDTQKYNDYLNQQQKMRNEDLPKLEDNLTSMKKGLDDYINNTDVDMTDTNARKAFDWEIKQRETEIDRWQQYVTQTRRLQKYDADSKRFADIRNRDDFAENSGFDTGNQEIGYRYVNSDAEGRLDLEQQYGDPVRQFGSRAWDSLNDEEKQVYNYLMNTGDREGAADYLRHLEENLQFRKGQEADAAMDALVAENPKAKALRYAFMANVGLDQNRSAMEDLGHMIAGNTDYRPISSTQYAGQLMREDLGNDGKKHEMLGGVSTGQMVGDIISTTANMAPSILTSTVIGLLNPAAGATAGKLMMSGGAAGSGYREMINEGYSKEQARLYGLGVGAAEYFMESALGGISKLGGAPTKALTKWAENVDNVLFKFALQLGGSGISEGVEEGLTEVVSGWLKSQITHDDFYAEPVDVLYSSLLGMATGVLFEAPDAAVKSFGKKATDQPMNATQLANTATPELSNATETAGKSISLPGNATADNLGAVSDKMKATEAVAKNAPTTVGASKMETVQSKPDIDSFAQQFGTQAEAVRRNYIEGQDLQEYEVGFQTAYAIGLEGGKAEALTKVPYLSQSQREIAFSMGRDAAAAQKAAAPKKAAVTAKMTTEEGTQDVTIAEVVDMDDTTMTFRLEDGRTVTDNDLDFEKGQELMAAAWELGMDVKSVNTIVTESAANAAADADQAAGIQQAHHYGQHGYTMEQLTKHGTDAAALTDGQRKAAWEAGRQIYLQKAAEPAPALKAPKTSGVWFDAGGGNVRSFDAADLSGLSETAVAGARAAQVLQKLGIGRNYYFFESYKNKAGERVYRDENGVEKKAPNGWYDPDGSIHIDLNAGANGNGLTLYTLSHELTHFVEKQDKQAYRRLAEFLVASYAKHTSVDELVTRKQAELSESRGVEVSYEDAYSEFIADSMEAMLSDGNVLEKLQELKKTDKSLFDKIREFFDNLGKKIREIYKDLTPDSLEGQTVLQMKDQIDQIQQLFAEALTEASENLQAAEEIGLEVDTDTESVSPAVMYFDRKKKGMDDSEISAIQNIGRISVNAFTSQDIKATEKLARRYSEEMGVKSPFFRAWFGDWRVNDQTQVQIADQTGDARGVQRNDDTGWDITVSGQVFNETKSHRGLANKSAQPYLPYINDIVRKAVLLDSYGVGVGKAKSDNSLLMHSMYAVANIGNGPEVLKLYVEEMNNPASDLTTKRSYQLQNIEKAFNASVRVQGQAPSSLTSTLNAVKIVADLFAAVKRYDTAFAPNPVSKAVNTDGTPLEMYHGTSNSGFTVFNTYGGNFGLFGKGSYFTDSPEVADSYTRKGKGQNPGVYGVYLSIKNPLDMDAKADLNAWKKAFKDADLDPSYLDGAVTNEDAFRQLKENLADEEYLRWEAEDLVTELIEGMGYDGITHIGGGRYGSKDGPKHRVYIAFEPEQIKSSTENIGTFDGSNPDIRYQDRSTGTSNRALLVNALESTTQDEAELTKLREYRLSIEHLDKQESKLATLRAEIRDISFGKGSRDSAKLKELQEEAEKIAKEIHKADKKLLHLEAAAPLQRVLEREKAKAQKWTQAKTKQIQERRRERREQTLMRHKITRVVNELNDLLTKPTKTRHVLPGLQKPVAEMLEALNMGSDEKQEQINKQIARYQELLAKEKSQPDPQLDVIEAYKAKIEKLQYRGEKLSDNIALLKNAYAEIKKSTDPEVAGAYMPELEEQLDIMREEVGDTPLQDMTLQQMDIVYEAYKMVLHNVRQANHLYGRLQKITAAEMTREACGQMRSNGINTKDPPKLLKDAAAWLNSMNWQNLRPVDAFRRLGSEKMMQLFRGLVDGMADRGLMIREIRDYLVNARKNCHYSKFDFKKADTYTTVDGKEMKLTLGEKMSIYAYSKRDAAFDHMTEGGFTYARAQTYKDEKGVTRYHNNAGGTWKLSQEDLEAICGSLSEEQRRYTDAMQKFLTEFGQRGNAVSRALFGIDLFKEQNYFPLMSNHDYLNSVQTDLGETQTAASLKNSGFTKHTTPGANNPIVLKSFDDVCLEHLDKMVNYIALTLPLENLRKVYDNVSSATPESDPQSTKALIGAVYGEEAKQYFDQFLKDANGTRGITGAKNPLAKLFSKSKAAAVSANFSVMIQQISAVFRASAEISIFHLISARGYGKGTTRGKKSYEEMMRYSGLANIKDAGGFDVGSTTGLSDYIGLEEAPRSAKKTWETFQDIFGMGAEFMDKVGWTMIWNAVKREVASRKMYTVNSAEFYQVCAERFNEIIVNTQVFDSVLSRSGFMRSDNDGVKYLTSFMGEPTVTAGMVFNTHSEVLRAVKAKKDVGYHIRKLIRTDAALLLTLLLNGMLKAFPYAMRDDDEDESFWERWAKHLGDNLRGDLNPLNLLPAARDISSIIQGRTVERPDLALLADLFTAGQNAVEALSDEEKREELQAEDYWILAEDLLGAIGNMAGVPIQNIWRDVESYRRLWKDMTDDIETVEMKESFKRGFAGNEKTKLEGIYDAMVSGDAARLNALKDTYKTDSGYESAVRKALRLHDPRIKEMADARYEDDYDRLEALSLEIESEDIFDMATIKAAYEAERAAQAKERGITLEEDSAAEQTEESTVFSMEEYYAAIRNGSKDSIQTAYNALIEEKKQEYYLEREAEDSIASSVASKVKGEYLNEDISRADAKSILTKYGGKSKAEAETEIKKWEFQMEYHYAWGSRDRCYRSGTITRSQLVSAVMDIEDASREEAQEYVDFLELEMQNEKVDITASEASSYFEHAKPHGISVEVYLDYKARTKGIQNDKDANGDSIPYTAVQKIMTEIDKLPISSNQKYALARSNGWAEKTIQKYKTWH